MSIMKRTWAALVAAADAEAVPPRVGRRAVEAVPAAPEADRATGEQQEEERHEGQPEACETLVSRSAFDG